MIRNIFYSLFLHSILIVLIYSSFNFDQPIEIEKTSKVSVSFVARVGNAVDVNQNKVLAPKVPSEMPTPPKEPHLEIKTPDLEPKPEKKPEKKPEPKKENPPKDKTKKEKPKKKKSTPKPSLPKVEPKQNKPKEPDAKTEVNKLKKDDKKPDAKQEPEKPKFEEKKPEVKDDLDKPKMEEISKKEVDSEENVDEQSPEEEQYNFTENSIESLDLLARDKFNIKTQITRCYKKALDEMGGDNKEVVNVHIFIDKDGVVDVDKAIIKDFYRYKDPQEKDFIRSVNMVKEALKFCSPIRNLPPDKYDAWKEMDLEFEK